MSIDIKLMAEISKIAVTEEKAEQLEKDMRAVLKLADSLPENDDETFSWVDASRPMPLRPDVVVPSMEREKLLANASKTANGCYLVPKTVE